MFGGISGGQCSAGLQLELQILGGECCTYVRTCEWFCAFTIFVGCHKYVASAMFVGMPPRFLDVYSPVVTLITGRKLCAMFF